MCGLAGAIGVINPTIVSAVHRMNAAMVHRGPDDEGCWSSPSSRRDQEDEIGAVLAHRRLSIIDLSEAGHQPMVDPATGNAIVYNGEVYNFREIRRELESRGVSFQSHCDTEVVLHAYAAWGANCVERFRGMFAIAIWDHTRRSLFVARDRLGIKPLYLARVRPAGGRTTLLFASELRAILESDLVDRVVDPAGLATYLWNGFVIGPRTLVDGVELLPAGTTMTIGADAIESTMQPQPFWRIPDAAPGVATVSDLKHELAEAVRLRLISDVPLGVFLSGGIDSSAVAALAVQASDAPVRTFNISFDESAYDESPYAAAVAKSLGTDHTDVRLTESMFRAHLHDALEALDQPTFDGINTFFVSRAVREAGMTVALAGVGGDELFGGYRSFDDVPRAARWSRRFAPVPGGLMRMAATAIGRMKTRSFSDMPPQTRWGKLADVFAARGDLLATYQISYGLFTRDFLTMLSPVAAWIETRHGLPPDRAAALSQWIAGNPDCHAVSMLELTCYTGERLLRDIDATSMASSLEVRVPLLDHEVVQTAAGLDLDTRFKPLGRKQALRDAALGSLDPAIFERPKSGFVLPIDTWSRAAIGEEIDAAFHDASLIGSLGLDQEAIQKLWRAFQDGVPGIYWTRIWSLFILLWWCRRYGLRGRSSATAAPPLIAAGLPSGTDDAESP